MTLMSDFSPSTHKNDTSEWAYNALLRAIGNNPGVSVQVRTFHQQLSAPAGYARAIFVADIVLDGQFVLPAKVAVSITGIRELSELVNYVGSM